MTLCEDNVSHLLALKIEERGMRQEMWGASKVRTSEKIDSSREPPERNVA